jgi:cobalamin biosynthesis Mg chelatase CobN
MPHHHPHHHHHHHDHEHAGFAPHHRHGPGGPGGHHGRGRGPGGFGFSDDGGLPRGRKLSSDDLQLLLLALIAEQPSHGYELIRALEARSGGFYVPGAGDVPADEAFARHDPDKPTVGICFYRSHRITGNAAWVDELYAQIEAAGANAIAVWSTTLRRDADGNAILDAARKMGASDTAALLAAVTNQT